MQKKTSQDRMIVRSRRMMIYTFLLILVFMYIGAKAEMRKMGGDETAETGQSLGTELGQGEEQCESNQYLNRDGADQTTGNGDNSSGNGRNNDYGRADKIGNEKNQHSRAEEAGPVIRSEEMWALILTNARYPIPEDYSVELKVLPGTEQSVDVRIYDSVIQMLSDMREQGMRPIVCSAYRTLDRQEILFNRKVKNYVKRGYTMEDAYKEARHVLSIPGSGEHCLGLAVDIFSQSYQKLEVGFENTKEGKWLREHCAEYGFILRYDKGKEESTGINYEPWHFRYVGVEVAEYMMEKGISLEEFYIEESLYG